MGGCKKYLTSIIKYSPERAEHNDLYAFFVEYFIRRDKN